jgi:hypothetical protein
MFAEILARCMLKNYGIVQCAVRKAIVHINCLQAVMQTAKLQKIEEFVAQSLWHSHTGTESSTR